MTPAQEMAAKDATAAALANPQIPGGRDARPEDFEPITGASVVARRVAAERAERQKNGLIVAGVVAAVIGLYFLFRGKD